VPDPENGEVQVKVVRRRSRRHRRNRLIRRCLVAVVIAVFTAGAFTVALRQLGPSWFWSRHPPVMYPQPDLARDRALTVNQIAQTQQARPVYPYSVVPGGVADVNELKWVAEHDPIVGAHYAGFNYERARVVRLTLARTVYLSYRIGNRIYWTSHRVKLRKGEELITDGRITARTRCANRVEETPQQAEASPVEPTPEAFEKPVRSGEGTAIQAPPAAFQSALLNRPMVPGLGPTGPLSVYDPLVGGNFISLSPPPLPEGLCSPVKKKNGASGVEVESATTGKKKKSGPCGSAGGGSPATVPEPGTWLLFASGLAAIYWQARRKLSPA
jgi:hypothetical protein